MEVRWIYRGWLGERWQMGRKIEEDGVKWREFSLKIDQQLPCPRGAATAEAKKTPTPPVAQRSPLYSSTSLPWQTGCHSPIPFLTMPVFIPLTVTGCDRYKSFSSLWAKEVEAHDYLHNWFTSWINDPSTLIETAFTVRSLLVHTSFRNILSVPAGFNQPNLRLLRPKKKLNVRLIKHHYSIL